MPFSCDRTPYVKLLVDINETGNFLDRASSLSLSFIITSQWQKVVRN